MTTSGTVVQARPLRMARLGFVSAGLVLVIFIVVAVVMPSANAGVTFGVKDQIGTGVVGLVVAGLFLMLTRPRLHADAAAVRMRSFLGGWRVVPWDVIVGVEFPSKVRFARIVLPGDETLALYAVQRFDKEQAVEKMRELRLLFAAVHDPTSPS